MHYLITGGAGYIGSELSAQLASAGFKVTINDKADPPLWLEEMPGVEVVRKDIRMGLAYASAPDCIVHLAAIVGHRECDSNQGLAGSTNEAGTLQVALAAKRLDVPVFYASTGAVYGAAGFYGRVNENFEPQPLSYYAATKLRGERHVCDAGGCVLRLNHVSGVAPRMSWGLVNHAARTAARREAGAFELYDPETLRPGTALADIVMAIESASSSELRGIYDVAGYNHRKGDVAALMLDKNPAMVIRETSPGVDLNNYTISAERFRDATGWQPKRSLRDAFDEVWSVNVD